MRYYNEYIYTQTYTYTYTQTHTHTHNYQQQTRWAIIIVYYTVYYNSHRVGAHMRKRPTIGGGQPRIS
jgi:hypothetical protein